MCIKLTISKLFFFFFFLFIGNINYAQELDYIYEKINTDNGLPTNGIKGLQFDEKTRFLWIATESGIVRYNGHSIQDFVPSGQKPILNNRIVYFTKAEDGTLFGKFIDATTFTIKLNDVFIGKASSQNNNLAEYLNLKYLLPINFKKNSLSTLDFKSFKIYNKIYTINEHYLLKYNSGKFDTIALLKNVVNSFQLGNRLFIINDNAQLFELIMNKINNNFSYKRLNSCNKYLNSNQNISVFQDMPSNDVFLIIGDKLYRIMVNNGNFSFELVIKNLQNNEFYKFVQFDTLTKTIYLGTDNRGVVVCRPRMFKRILPINKLKHISTSVYAQVLLKNGNIQNNDGIIFGSNTNKSNVIFKRISSPNTYISKNNILYFTNADGMHEYDLSKEKFIRIVKDRFVNRNVFIELGDYMYAFNDIGIIKKNINISSDSWKYDLKFKSLPLNFIVYDVKRINSVDLLIATSDGLYKYNLTKHTFKLFYRDELKSNFRTIFKLNDFYLIGTYGGGVYLYKSDTIKKIPTDQKGFLNFTHCFLEDEEQRIWATTNKGIFMSTKNSLIDFWYNGPGSIVYKYFGKIDGIDVLEMNGGCTPCGIKLPNGDFSIPGIDGIIQFNPFKIKNYNINPLIYIDKVYVDNILVPIDSNTYKFKNNIDRIDIQLGISGMLSEENIIVEYKRASEKMWNRMTIKDPIIHIDNPSYGPQTLKIRWRNSISSNWMSKDIKYYVSYPIILHPFMFILYLFLIFFLIYLFVRIKTIIYQKRQKELESEVQLKTNSLLKLNKYLTERNLAKDQVLAIMNHDVLTPLKYLHMAAKNIEPQIDNNDLKKSIQQIATTSKELEYLTSNMLNWVKFDNSTKLFKSQKLDLNILVNNLFEFVKPFILDSNVALVNNIPPKLEIFNWPEALRILLYNIIINSIKSTEFGEITVSINQKNDNYSIIIEDTGIGMSESMINFLKTGKSKDEVENLPKYKKGNGVGFQIIRNIIKLMKAKLDIESKEKGGTRVTIKFKN